MDVLHHKNCLRRYIEKAEEPITISNNIPPAFMAIRERRIQRKEKVIDGIGHKFGLTVTMEADFIDMIMDSEIVIHEVATVPQIEVLMYLSKQWRGRRILEVSKEFGYETDTATNILNSLVNTGLAQKGKNNGRYYMYKPTCRGYGILRRKVVKDLF